MVWLILFGVVVFAACVWFFRHVMCEHDLVEWVMAVFMSLIFTALAVFVAAFIDQFNAVPDGSYQGTIQATISVGAHDESQTTYVMVGKVAVPSTHTYTVPTKLYLIVNDESIQCPYSLWVKAQLGKKATVTRYKSWAFGLPVCERITGVSP